MKGQKIGNQKGKLQVPDNPIIPLIEGDGTGPDIWAASVCVLDAAVEKAYGGSREIVWQEAADLIVKGLQGAIGQKRETYDFARLMDGVDPVKCSGFGTAIIENM